MRRTATILLLFGLMTSTALAQSVETVLTSPLVADYLALDKATGHLYLTNYTQVSRLAPDGTLTPVTDGTFITGLGVSASGDLYYNDSMVGTIFRIDSNGNRIPYVTGLQDPIGIWMSANNDGFYTQTFRGEGKVYFIGFDRSVTELYSGLGEGWSDIVADEAGNIYVAHFNLGLIRKIATDGTVTDLADIPSWVGYITYVNDYIYATGWQKHLIYRVDVATGAFEPIAGTGTPGLTDGDALSTAQFNQPNGIVASVTGDTLYVSDIRTDALRRVITATATDVEVDADLPEGFALAQNFPNPFNPQTTIPYTLTHTTHVTLTVTDLLGREVATLVSQTQAPGTYTITWNARNQPSGLYLYRLETDTHTQVRRMVLQK